MVIGLRRDQGLEAAAYDIRNGPSQRTSDEFQATVREMEDEELRLMVSRKAEAEQRFNQSKVAVIFGTILGLLITAAAAWSVWRDGSRRGQAEEALQDSEEQYRMLLDEVQDHAIVMMDPQGKIVTWNAGAERIKGYSADQIIGQDFSCFYLPEDIARGRPQEILRLNCCQRPPRRTWHARAKRRLAILGERHLHGVARSSGKSAGIFRHLPRSQREQGV